MPSIAQVAGQQSSLPYRCVLKYQFDRPGAGTMNQGNAPYYRLWE
jgi:hypothetical protein